LTRSGSGFFFVASLKILVFTSQFMVSDDKAFYAAGESRRAFFIQSFLFPPPVAGSPSTG
jgi:hypothetical protein